MSCVRRAGIWCGGASHRQRRTSSFLLGVPPSHSAPGREILHWQELMNTQSRLQQSENCFQATFEQAAVGIALVSPMVTGCGSTSACATCWATSRRAHRDDVPAA